MANSILKKGTAGYNYKYTDLNSIHIWLEEQGLSYRQFTQVINGNDYIYTIKIDADGKESEPIQGSRIIVPSSLNGKVNEAQQYGSGLTYARRYSLLMAYGLSCSEDDAECYTKQPVEPQSTKSDYQIAHDILSEHIVLLDWFYKNEKDFPIERKDLNELLAKHLDKVATLLKTSKKNPKLWAEYSK